MGIAPKKHLRLWFQNCNGLVHKGDMREYQFDLANIADHSVNYMSFTETCVNSSKLGYHTKLVDAYKNVIPIGGIRFANTSNYPPTSFY